MAFVFEKLKVTKQLNNLQILLLEEDYYLFPDSIHVLRKLSEKILSDIDVVSLAVFEKLKQNLNMKNFNKYSKAYWHSQSHNTGLMIGRKQWQMVKECLSVSRLYYQLNGSLSSRNSKDCLRLF